MYTAHSPKTEDHMDDDGIGLEVKLIHKIKHVQASMMH